MSKQHMGYSLDEFLKQEGNFDAAQARAIEEVVVWQHAETMKKQHLSKNKKAARLKTSRTQVNRLLDPKHDITLSSLQRSSGVRWPSSLCRITVEKLGRNKIMVVAGTHENIPVEEIELDRSNPRIRKFLEMYGGNPTPEQIFLALGAGNDDEDVRQDVPTFQKLKQSIITSGGIIQPVILNRRADGTLVCIEGNTRVALYRDFLGSGQPGSWSTIPALVHKDIDDADVHAIRLQVHLVGPRPWDPYSKAKYLYELRHKEHLPFSKIVDFCGGRQSEVSTFIDAYNDMETYYRPIIADDGDFDTTRFSGFVELQKPGVKQAVTQAGFNYKDFAVWIRDNKLFPLRTVRVLPRILRNTKAREVFLKSGAREAEKVLDKPEIDKNLQDADLGQIARALTEKLATLPYEQYQRLRADSTGETVQALLEAQEKLLEFIRDLG